MHNVTEIQRARQQENRGWVRLSQHILGCNACSRNVQVTKNAAATACTLGDQYFAEYIAAHEGVGEVVERIDAELAKARPVVK